DRRRRSEVRGQGRADVGGQRGGGRLASVIQAFGGERYADVGWPRLPTWQEMDCLAFLSVVHGSRGVFFYTYGIMGQTEEGREKLGRVVGRLNRIYPWLIEENLDQPVKVEMMSSNRVDPKGRATVHCCLKKKGNEMLLIAVNTIGTSVEALLGVEDKRGEVVREVFSGEDYVVVDGRIRVKFGPYETKAFLFRAVN
ncbi:MAG: alpha-glucosidase C-terminal domain-containing protein, partial [Desulfobacterales bacterium]|nr:alpha-glucosidase C-terminal domain-containing protein [Desulfobacterales bacterium]